MLNRDQIDINFRTDNGETLVMLSVSSSTIFNESSVDQLNYVVNKLGGNCQLTDSNGNNAFHYLASNTVDVSALEQELKESGVETKLDQVEFKKLVAEKVSEQIKFRIKMATILLKAKCNPNKANNELDQPLSIAIQNLNKEFARTLLTRSEFGCSIKAQQNPNGKTLLSLMSEKCTEMDICYILFGDNDDKVEFPSFLFFVRYSTLRNPKYFNLSILIID